MHSPGVAVSTGDRICSLVAKEFADLIRDELPNGRERAPAQTMSTVPQVVLSDTHLCEVLESSSLPSVKPEKAPPKTRSPVLKMAGMERLWGL